MAERPAGAEIPVATAESPAREAWRMFPAQPVGDSLGLVLLAAIVLISLFGPPLYASIPSRSKARPLRRRASIRTSRWAPTMSAGTFSPA